jgi:ferredoxin
MMLKLKPEFCGECGGCVAVCPYDALVLLVEGLSIKDELCVLCNKCVEFCPTSALEVE